MRKNFRNGTTLVEVLVVIVIFLVGILGLLQAFPPGLALLRATRNHSQGQGLVRAQLQALQGEPDRMPETIAPVLYLSSGVVTLLDPSWNWRELMPRPDVDAIGRIDQNGLVQFNGASVDHWSKVSGSNHVSRVIGEPLQARTPQPGPLGLEMTATTLFGPFYYVRQNSGVGSPGLVQVYGNDLRRRFGSMDFRVNPNPNGTTRPYEFYFVEQDDTAAASSANNPFPEQTDQLWISSVDPLTDSFRISLSFAINQAGTPANFDVVVVANPTLVAAPNFMRQVGKYWVINLKQLIGQPGVNGEPGYNSADFLSAEFGSVRVQRMFQEIPLTASFSPVNPLQYKVASDTGRASIGAIQLNPLLSVQRVPTDAGIETVVQPRIDYTVFDWRILREPIRVPELPVGSRFTAPVRLAVNSLISRNQARTDGTIYQGMGMTVPDPSLTTLDADFAVVDAASGGIVLGNLPGNTRNGYVVDKSNGALTFVDTNLATPGLQLWVGRKTTPATWDFVEETHNQSRFIALYGTRLDWSVQVQKASSTYRPSQLSPQGIGAAQVYVGATQAGIGQPNRLYFPFSDLGHRVTIEEIWHTVNGTVAVLRDQEFLLEGVEVLGGVPHAYVDIRAKATSNPAATVLFNYSANNYSVRGVKGASVRVRALWNPERFSFGPDPADNYTRLEEWMRNTRRAEAEGFLAGGLRS